jgi:hypothetical protein
MECIPLWPTYIDEKGRTLGKTYGFKARCYWKHPWGTHWEPREHIENLMRTHKELEGKMTKEKRKTIHFHLVITFFGFIMDPTKQLLL